LVGEALLHWANRRDRTVDHRSGDVLIAIATRFDLRAGGEATDAWCRRKAPAGSRLERGISVEMPGN
jgi:hypothetical protein